MQIRKWRIVYGIFGYGNKIFGYLGMAKKKWKMATKFFIVSFETLK